MNEQNVADVVVKNVCEIHTIPALPKCRWAQNGPSLRPCQNGKEQ